MTTPADDEFTELVDFNPDRVDAVGKGANGVPRFLIAKQDAARGLVPPDLVRELVAKEGPGDGRHGEITMTGSPAAIASFIHKAAQRAAERTGDDELTVTKAAYDTVLKGKYNAADLKRMAASGAAMEDESYPIGDEDDLHNAIRAVGRGGSSHDAIRRHVISRAKSLGKASMIPDNWAADGSLKEQVSKDMADMGPDLDEGVDGMDPTVPLAAPDEDAPGDPTEPGSPMWEAIDAATAQKWLSIAVRLKNALGVLAEREMLEAASADPDDIENAWDLEDAQCAVDFVIEQLAVFAAGEQAEADLGGEAMDAVGKSAQVNPVEEHDPAAVAAIRKALGDELLPAALSTVETYSAVVRKTGRVLSSVNEQHIREAATRLNTVLSSLPQAPTSDDGQPVSKETAMADTDTPAAEVAKDASPDEQAADSSPVMAGGTNGMGAPKAGAEALPGDMPGRQVVKALQVAVYDAGQELAGLVDPAAIVQRVTKADDGDGKKAMQAVFDQDGDLIGIVDPDAIQPVTGAGGKPADPDGDGTPAAAPAADDTDMTPAPAAETGTPADAVADDDVAKQDGTLNLTESVLKSIITEAVTVALGAQAPAEDIAKQADVAGLHAKVEALLADVNVLKEQPMPPKVFLNGQTPRPDQMRGQDQGATQPVDVAKALDRKREFAGASAADQNRIAAEMQAESIAYLEAIHSRRVPS